MPVPAKQRNIKRNRYLQENRNYRPHRTSRAGQNDRKEHSAAPLVLLAQCALTLLLLAAVFTMQFFEPQQYEAAGAYYQQVVSGEETEDPTLKTLSTPLTIESIKTYLESWTPEKIMQVFSPQEEPIAAGGEESTFPRNASFTKVVVSAPARSPLPCDAVITSGYGVRPHPISGDWDFHTGIDLAAPEGTEIRAIYPGSVMETGWSESYGNYIVLSHGEHLSTLYCHCSRILASEGDSVKAGETIALVGTTGISTGAHLHLSVLLDGYYIDPINLYDL